MEQILLDIVILILLLYLIFRDEPSRTHGGYQPRPVYKGGRVIPPKSPTAASLKEGFLKKGGRNPPPLPGSERPPHPPAQYPKI